MMKWKKNLYVITIIAVILVSGCLNESKSASKDDFKITIKPNEQGLVIKQNDLGELVYSALLTIESNNPNLTYRVYDKTDNVEFLGHTLLGSYSYEIDILFSELNQTKEIIIYASNYSSFSKTDEGLINKTLDIMPPNIDVSISPEILSFKASKMVNVQRLDYVPIEPKTMIVENTGDIGLHFYVFPNESQSLEEPAYIYSGEMGKFLKAGESFEFSVYPTINYDTKLGVTDITGYIYAIPDSTKSIDKAIFKKPFYLKTMVMNN